MEGERIHNVLPPFHRDQLFPPALGIHPLNPPPSALSAPGQGLGLSAQGLGLGLSPGNLRIQPGPETQKQGLGSGLGSGLVQGLASGQGLVPGSGQGQGESKDAALSASQVVRQVDVINHGVTKPVSRWLGTTSHPYTHIHTLIHTHTLPHTHTHIHPPPPHTHTLSMHPYVIRNTHIVSNLLITPHWSMDPSIIYYHSPLFYLAFAACFSLTNVDSLPSTIAWF